MNTEEIELPFIKEDFEIGTRVYRYIRATDNAAFGTVTSVNDNNVTVSFDKGGKHLMIARFEDFKATEGADVAWGKCLPLRELYVGCPISLTSFGQKVTATVTYVSDESITVYYREPQKLWNTYHRSKELSLEAQLMFWEIEG